MGQVFEAAMIVCFGVSWPLAIYKSWVARTAKGKSLPFLIFILLGYALGISSKIIGNNITYVLFFYVLNFMIVSVDLLLYFRNRNIDRKVADAA